MKRYMLKTETYLLKVAIFSALILFNACASLHHDGTEPPPATSTSAQTFVFSCIDGLEFVARADDEEAWLFLTSGTLRLPRTEAGTYRDSQALFQLVEQEASLDRAGVKHLKCKNDRRRAIWEHAKLNGADYRAIGNEPGWDLVIRNQETIILITDYGSTRNEFVLPEPEVNIEERTTRYEAKGTDQEMTLTISGEICRDSMSGEEFPSKATVNLDGQTLYGCGRALH
jgi:uncharacterized membrane protein